MKTTARRMESERKLLHKRVVLDWTGSLASRNREHGAYTERVRQDRRVSKAVVVDVVGRGFVVGWKELTSR